jgi:hypothetical protein
VVQAVKKHTRRTVLTKAAYVAPAIVSLQATSALAKAGSEPTFKPKKRKRRK